MNHKLKPGYVSILAVLTLTGTMMLMLISTYRFSVAGQQAQKQTQLRLDYTNREQTLLRAIINETTNSAMRCMMADSNNTHWTTPDRWRWIFQYSRDLADGETALDGDVAEILGINANSTSGNTGDGDQGHILYAIDETIYQSHYNGFYINAGTNSTGAALGSEYPETLVLNNGSVELLDRDRPIITTEKTYSDGSLYKSIPYPNVHFGYSTQGQNFVAKRNWWAFTINYGATTSYLTGVQAVEKDYVLSIYEVPSQLGLGSTSMTFLGAHADGSSWANVSIQGSVFVNEGTTQGSLSLDRLASRRGTSILGDATVGGVGLDQFSGELISREEYEASNASFFPVSSSANSGMVAFVPINVGNDAFDDLSNTEDNNRASPTGWNWYSRPAMQCAMKLRVEEVFSPADQTPTKLSFTYKESGIDKTVYFTRGTDWPTEDSTEGATFPFHLEETQYGRQGVAVYIGRLANYLSSVGADSLEVNNSLVVNSNYVDNLDVAKPNIPSLSTDLALIFRDTKDFTMFPKGFSLVTPYRMYLANDVNIVSSGTDPSGNAIYPPISLFAPEKRFGLREQAINIDFEGQLNYLGKDSDVRPIDLRSGIDDEVIASNIAANLYSISDPGKLPPINQMNWLVVIEEVR